ncbi:PAC2 family protein [Terracoccus luteus]|uniref:Putative ATP-grasp superfamily ATP-dependent carboligase n=1 Tax=Terracoccus luteus TaxID=53356 RepID=A0A495XXA4_9MICO|nr:PAC2 family protein [Terracoccus luteus]MBB2987671.1 putative ATP-grasp superfamily ATP-dependent carboligase [Terracoccus luteus]MCP2173322.1 putative ATP-grasp superfamily ATP-dependent carboligase [Terracoccus luteus]RKT78059.1 putative ATP-grasp superfamily ATP-dependent carboligase [Terracoccus luteus]
MLEFEDVPDLVDPVLIAAFEGWNDAGEAATSVVRHLSDVWEAELVAAFDPEDYYDFQVNRPRVLLDEGQRVLSWPTTRILVATETGFERDVVLVQGIEPSMRWRAFSNELLELARHFGVTTVVTIGALLADVPHTRPIPVTATAEDDSVMHRYDVEPSRYEGPTGIVGVLSHTASEAGLPTLSAWAAVPHYAGGAPSPKATLSLVRRLESLLGVTVPHGELEENARAWERGVDELAQSDEEVAEYVQSLEEAQDTAELPEASGDAIAREFERYLRGRDDDQTGK